MKRLTVFAALTLMASSVFAQCQPIGWRLVSQKSISITERLCVYEKNGVRLSIIADGFCPYHPC